MRKIAWCGVVAAALVASSTGALADVQVSKGAGAAPTKLAAMQPDTTGGGAGTQTTDGQTADTTPPPVRPRPKAKSNFFGLPLVGVLAGVGGGVAVAASSGDDNPVSP